MDKNRTKYTILGMLSIEPMSGYQIKQAIKRSTAFFWSESDGQIYPALAQCVEQGWATFQEQTSKTSARAKKTYKITLAGKKELISWLGKKVQNTPTRNELLLKLFFGKNVEDHENIHHLRTREKEMKDSLTLFVTLRDNLERDYKKSPHLKYWIITLNHGIKMAKAELSWCSDTLKILENVGEVASC